MLNNTERRGFAIPIAILVIAVLTIMIAGGFSLVSAERRSVADQKSQISAFRIAEQGNEIYLEALLCYTKCRDLRLLVGNRSALGAHERESTRDHDRQHSYDQNCNRDGKSATFSVVQHMGTLSGYLVRF